METTQYAGTICSMYQRHKLLDLDGLILEIRLVTAQICMFWDSSTQDLNNDFDLCYSPWRRKTFSNSCSELCVFSCTVGRGGALKRNCLFVFIYGKQKSKIMLTNSRHTYFSPQVMKILILYVYTFKVILYFLTPQAVLIVINVMPQ